MAGPVTARKARRGRRTHRRQSRPGLAQPALALRRGQEDSRRMAASRWTAVAAALVIALAWTLPLGVAIGSSPRLAAWLQPLVQILAAVPATALFPIVVLVVAGLPGGMNLAAVLLMLLGTPQR